MELVALAGISIKDPITPGEAVRMAKARDMAAWGYVSTICSFTANIMRKGRAIKPDDINPYTAKSKKLQGLSHKEFITLLKGVKHGGNS